MYEQSMLGEKCRVMTRKIKSRKKKNLPLKRARDPFPKNKIKS